LSRGARVQASSNFQKELQDTLEALETSEQNRHRAVILPCVAGPVLTSTTHLLEERWRIIMSRPSYSVNNATFKMDIPVGWYSTISSVRASRVLRE